jgi:organic radical activating enzyme
MAKQTQSQSPIFQGTVAELAGKMAIGGEPLNQQDVQFLTRILRETGHAKAIDTAPATGKRGGKRATVWQIMPNIKLSLSEAANEAPAKSTKGHSNATVDTSSPEFKKAVQAAADAAVQKVLNAGKNGNGNKATATRGGTRKGARK